MYYLIICQGLIASANGSSCSQHGRMAIVTSPSLGSLRISPRRFWRLKTQEVTSSERSSRKNGVKQAISTEMATRLYTRSATATISSYTQPRARTTTTNNLIEMALSLEVVTTGISDPLSPSQMVTVVVIPVSLTHTTTIDFAHNPCPTPLSKKATSRLTRSRCGDSTL